MLGGENMVSRKNARQGASKNGVERKPGHLWSGENFPGAHGSRCRSTFRFHVPFFCLSSERRFASTVQKIEVGKRFEQKRKYIFIRKNTCFGLKNAFLPSFMFPNSTVFFHTTLNSPTQLSAPCRATQEKCRSTSLKKFTRKCSKLARDAAQRLQNYPPFFCQSATGKIRTALSPGALYPPLSMFTANSLTIN